MMKRREFITLLSRATGWPLVARAQQPSKQVLRVGTVSGTNKSSPQWVAFLRRMADLGYQEGNTFTFDLVTVANDNEYEAGYRSVAAHKPDIILATGPEIALKSALAVTPTEHIAEFALHRIVSMFVFREWVEAGGLLSYGPSITAQFVRVAEVVDRLARGAKPSDLPIEQPTRFELVLNLKTAKAIGLAVPPSLLVRADEAIE